MTVRTKPSYPGLTANGRVRVLAVEADGGKQNDEGDDATGGVEERDVGEQEDPDPDRDDEREGQGCEMGAHAADCSLPR